MNIVMFMAFGKKKWEGNSMTQDMVKKLNEQINAELQSGYIYLDYASWLDSQGLSGYANWYKLQAQEEYDHAKRIYDYLVSNGERVKLFSILLNENPVNSLEEVLNGALNHEKYVTTLINDLYTSAKFESDYRTAEFLLWFINEQLEEEKSATEMLEKYVLYGDAFLYQLDKEASKRQQ